MTEAEEAIKTAQQARQEAEARYETIVRSTIEVKIKVLEFADLLEEFACSLRDTAAGEAVGNG